MNGTQYLITGVKNGRTFRRFFQTKQSAENALAKTECENKRIYICLPVIERVRCTEREIGACERYLKHMGYEVVDTNYETSAGVIDIVAFDDETLVFVECRSVRNEFFYDVLGADRAIAEAMMIEYLTDHSVNDGPVRFDILSLSVIGDSSAALRHHKNALGIA